MKVLSGFCILNTLVIFLLVNQCDAAGEETLTIFTFSRKVDNIFYYLNYFAEVSWKLEAEFVQP